MDTRQLYVHQSSIPFLFILSSANEISLLSQTTCLMELRVKCKLDGLEGESTSNSDRQRPYMFGFIKSQDTMIFGIGTVTSFTTAPLAADHNNCLCIL